MEQCQRSLENEHETFTKRHNQCSRTAYREFERFIPPTDISFTCYETLVVVSEPRMFCSILLVKIGAKRVPKEGPHR